MLRKVTSRSYDRLNSFCWPFLEKSKPKNGRIHSREFTLRNCRQIHGKPSDTSWSTALRDRFNEYRRNGVPEIIFGSFIFALVGIDYILQTRNDQQRETMYKQLEREVRRDEATSRKEDRRMLEEGIASMSKFKCIIRKVPLNFDGHKCLKNVKVGDVVTVLEEGVGPGGQYNLCSIDRDATTTGVESSENEPRISIGWYPCSCLQKIES
ncbi:hypothetical protein ACHAWU_004286 [Discostella pseudostelligera]|jgi:hypothetical protein|uniref:Uncharacterized protein n=1 Tax=Discostella pseudostelligera TaxID=259834 RepID=A0ABD3M6F2_9STRA